MTEKLSLFPDMLATHKGEIPFFILLLPFLLGLGLGLHFILVESIYILTAFYFFALLFTVFNLLYGHLKLYKAQWIGGLLISFIMIAFGWLSVISYNELNRPDHFSKQKSDYLLVKINNEPNLKNGIVRFTAAVNATVLKGVRTKSSGNLLVVIKDSIAAKLSYGDELLIPATYQPVDPPFNPAEFNYKQYLANQNIHLEELMYGHHFALIGNNAGNPLIAYSLTLRKWLVEKFKMNMHDTTAIAVASTLILGYKADLSNDVLQAYSKTGTVHVLSVSGAHVAIVFILLNLLLGFMDRHRFSKLVKAAIIIIVIWYYSMLTGFSPAVCRAALMISLVIIGRTYSRHINTLNILAVSAFLLLIYDPYFVTDVGFQLSYLAVFGLIIFQPIVYKVFDFKNRWVDKLWALCSVSIAAQVITFPLSAFYFHQFPVYFLVSNLFIIIPSAVIMYAGIAYLLLPQVPFLSKALAWLLEQSILGMNKVLTFIEQAPYASVGKIWINTAEYLLLYAFIIACFCFIYLRRFKPLQLALLSLFAFFVLAGFKRIDTLNTNTIAFLNLRKHTGVIFKSGNKAVVLTDVADTDKTYKYSIQPYLDSCKVDQVEKVVLTRNYRYSFFCKQGNLIQYNKKLLLLFDKTIQHKRPLKTIKVDYLFATGNPSAGIDNLKQYYKFDLLIADANNFNALTDTLRAEAKANHFNFRTLRRNNAIVMLSN